MIKSMTGYGKSSFSSDDLFILVEMRSVNHRFSEFSIRMPRAFMEYEDKVKRVLSKHVKRGKVDVFVTIEGEDLLHRELLVDWKLMETYIETLKRAKQIHHISDDLTLDHLLHFPELFTIIEKETEILDVGQLLVKTADEAAIELVSMREQEGVVLRNNIDDRLTNIESVWKLIKARAPIVAEDFYERLQQKLTDMLSEHIDVDETRLLTEVAVFSEKSNIEEELTRLKSHLIQFRKTLNDGGVVGRKLDFIIQEMNREVNTIGSKANDKVIGRHVVELKSELEMIREQVQNVE